MICTTQYQCYELDPALGYKIVVTYTYSSFNKSEIDSLKNILKDTVGSCRVTEINTDKEDD